MAGSEITMLYDYEAQTNEKCPECNSQSTVILIEQDGPDDYKKILFCKECQERIDE